MTDYYDLQFDVLRLWRELVRPQIVAANIAALALATQEAGEGKE